MPTIEEIAARCEAAKKREERGMRVDGVWLSTIPYLLDEISRLESRLREATKTSESLSTRAEQAEAERDELLEANRWIPVSERLPDVYGKYLTCDFNGNIHVFEHDPKCEYPFFILPDSLRYYQPSHWRPLPQPPKGDG